MSVRCPTPISTGSPSSRSSSGPTSPRDKRFADRTERPKHFSELYQVLDSLLKHRTTEEWLEAFDKADIPAMPVRTLEELFDDPHLKATGFFTEREHPTEGPITTFASPLDFERKPRSRSAAMRRASARMAWRSCARPG